MSWLGRRIQKTKHSACGCARNPDTFSILLSCTHSQRRSLVVTLSAVLKWCLKLFTAIMCDAREPCFACPFGNSTSAGSSSSSHVPKLGYHSRGSLALLLLGSPASVLIALSSTESEVLSSLAAHLLPSAAASFVGYPRTCHRLPRSLSLSAQLCSISAPSIQCAQLVSYSFPPGEPCTWGRSAAAGLRLGMFQQRQTCRSCVSIGKCSGTTCVLCSEQRDRLGATEERVTDVADEPHRFCCEFMRALVCCALGRLQRAAQVCDCDGATSERGGECRGADLSGLQGFEILLVP